VGVAAKSKQEARRTSRLRPSGSESDRTHMAISHIRKHLVVAMATDASVQGRNKVQRRSCIASTYGQNKMMLFVQASDPVVRMMRAHTIQRW
jgi:hypothetical protein